MGELVHDYHEGNRYFHDRFDTRRLADRAAEVRTSSTFEDWATEFIERSNMFFIATCDHRGLPTCSYKGGERGFVRVISDQWLAFPNYDGNGRYLSMDNLLKNPNVGLLFVDFECPGRSVPTCHFPGGKGMHHCDDAFLIRWPHTRPEGSKEIGRGTRSARYRPVGTRPVSGLHLVAFA